VSRRQHRVGAPGARGPGQFRWPPAPLTSSSANDAGRRPPARRTRSALSAPAVSRRPSSPHRPSQTFASSSCSDGTRRGSPTAGRKDPRPQSLPATARVRSERHHPATSTCSSSPGLPSMRGTGAAFRRKPSASTASRCNVEHGTSTPLRRSSRCTFVSRTSCFSNLSTKFVDSSQRATRLRARGQAGREARSRSERRAHRSARPDLADRKAAASGKASSVSCGAGHPGVTPPQRLWIGHRRFGRGAALGGPTLAPARDDSGPVVHSCAETMSASDPGCTITLRPLG